MSSRPAPRFSAGPSSLAKLAEVYQQRQALQDEMERILWEPSSTRLASVEKSCSISTWNAQASVAHLIMVQDVRTTGDIAITLAMAATYLDTILDQMAEGGDKALLRSIATAIEHAVARLHAEGATIGMPRSVFDMVKDAGAVQQVDAA